MSSLWLRFTTAPVALLLLMGGMVMIYFVLLGGANDASPLNRIYFLQAATKGIPNAPDTSRWTFWSVCRLGSNGHSICPNHRPGVPLDPPGHWNFNTKDNIPHQFLGTRHYWYMSRFFFAFFLIEHFFAFLTLVCGLFACMSKGLSRTTAGLMTFTLILQCVTASLMTANYVKGRNHFNNDHKPAKLGHIAFGLMWGTVATFFLATVAFCLAGVPGGGGRSSRSRSARAQDEDEESKGLVHGHHSNNDGDGAAGGVEKTGNANRDSAISASADRAEGNVSSHWVQQ